LEYDILEYEEETAMRIQYLILWYGAFGVHFVQAQSFRAPTMPTIHDKSAYAVGGYAAEAWLSPEDSTGRFPIIFKNESIEAVQVEIYRLSLQPLPKHVVNIGEWRNFFPQQMTTHERPLYINLRGSSAGDLHYVLELNGKPRVGSTHACRAYGSLDLKQGNEIVQSIGASVLDSGLILTYTPYYDLEMTSLKDYTRGSRVHKDMKNAGRCRKRSCAQKNDSK
jgi:hypothetical protein